MKVNIKINRDKELNSKSEENIRKIKCYGDGKVKKMHVSERVLEMLEAGQKLQAKTYLNKYENLLESFGKEDYRYFNTNGTDMVQNIYIRYTSGWEALLQPDGRPIWFRHGDHYEWF